MPEDFGVINLALIFTQLAYVLFDFGLSSALVQRKEVTKAHFSTIFTVYLLSALFFTLLVFFTSNPIAHYFNHHELHKILNTLTMVFLLYALIAVPQIQLMREMRFKRLSGYQLVAALFYALTTIVFAVQGAGVWSFVYGLITEQFVLMILLNMTCQQRPGIAFDWSIFRQMISFGGNVLGTRVTNYINSNFPNFIIGKVLGATQLGYYALAYQLVEFPVQRISKNVLKVMFPAFSNIQDDMPNFRLLYKTTVYHLALITFPVFAGIFIIAPQFISIVYGEKWFPVITILQILTIIGLARSLWMTTSIIYLSKGKPQVEFKLTLSYGAILIPSLLLVAPYGISWVVGIVALIIMVFLVIAQVISLRIIHLKVLEIARVFRTPVIGVISFIAADMLLLYGISDKISDLAQLIILVIVSIVCYTLVIAKLDKNIFNKLIRFIRV